MKTVQLATGKAADTDLTMHNGWFVVRNSGNSPSAQGSQSEDELFSTGPWVNIKASRRGSKALKTHLGNVLSMRIRDAFPKLEESISARLSSSLADYRSMGSSRDTLPAQQQFLVTAVQKYRNQIDLALTRPGHQHMDSKELRKLIKNHNDEYDSFMRYLGHNFEFNEDDVDPENELIRLLIKSGQTSQDESGIRIERDTARQEEEAENSSFYATSMSEMEGELLDSIGDWLSDFQANQLPGVINPDIYPFAFQKLTKKWSTIAHSHLMKIADAVWGCIDDTLDDVCPRADDTQALNEGLRTFLRRMFDETLSATVSRLKEYCEQEERPVLLQTTNPRFAESLEACRRLRFYEVFSKFQDQPKDESSVDKFLRAYKLLNANTHQNMINDVHDVLKIYYGVSTPAHVTSTETR